MATGGQNMKKSSIIWLAFIIIAIIAMIKMGSFMGGLGFALTIFIVIFALMCIFGAIFLVFSCYEKIRCKDIIGSIGDILLIVLFAFLGIKILKWLIGVLL